MARNQTVVQDSSGNASVSNNFTAASLIKSGGTAAQILAANGSVITAGTGISISGGTISSSATGGVTSFNTRTGAVTLSSSDVTTALGYTPLSSYTETDTLATVTGRGSTTSTAITFSTTTDQMITLNATDSSWAYLGFSWVGTRKGYFGLNASGELEVGSDASQTFRVVGTSTMTVGGNTVLHAGNYTSYAQTKVYQGQSAGNWQTFTDDVGEFRVDEVLNITSGAHSNYPPNVYTYGGVLSWRLNNHSFQLYASHTGDLTFKTQWGNDNYSGWRRILHESNYNSWAPTLTGGGASGTWGISITGNAASVGGYSASGLWKLNEWNGNLYANTDGRIYGTIFYDANNDAYYANPNGTSRFNNLQLNETYSPSYTGQLILGSTSYNFNFLNGSWAGSITAGILANCSDDWEFAIHDSGHRVVSPFFFQGAGTNRILMGRDIGWGTTYIQAASSFRAPIFYDSDNTTYFWDGSAGKSMEVAGGIQIDALNNSNAYIAFNNASTYWGIIGNYGSNDWRIGIGSYSSMVDWNLRWDASGNAWANSSFRAPIFYDSNDTFYYIDPNSTSRVLRLQPLNLGGSTLHYRSTDIAVDSGSREAITFIDGSQDRKSTRLNSSYRT